MWLSVLHCKSIPYAIICEKYVYEYDNSLHIMYMMVKDKSSQHCFGCGRDTGYNVLEKYGRFHLK